MEMADTRGIWFGRQLPNCRSVVDCAVLVHQLRQSFCGPRLSWRRISWRRSILASSGPGIGRL